MPSFLSADILIKARPAGHAGHAHFFSGSTSDSMMMVGIGIARACSSRASFELVNDPGLPSRFFGSRSVIEGVRCVGWSRSVCSSSSFSGWYSWLQKAILFGPSSGRETQSSSHEHSEIHLIKKLLILRSSSTSLNPNRTASMSSSNQHSVYRVGWVAVR